MESTHYNDLLGIFMTACNMRKECEFFSQVELCAHVATNSISAYTYVVVLGQKFIF